MSDSALQQAFELLHEGGDISIFTGLRLLVAALDSHPHITNDPNLVSEIWSHIPKRFLIRLLKTRAGDATNEDARISKHLAVGVIRSFLGILPSDELKTEATTSLCVPLLDALLFVDKFPQVLSLQALQLMAAHEPGAAQILDSDALPVLIRMFIRHGDEDGPKLPLWELIRVIRVGHELKPSLKSQWNAMIAENFNIEKPFPIALMDMLTDVTNHIEVHLNWLTMVCTCTDSV